MPTRICKCLSTVLLAVAGGLVFNAAQAQTARFVSSSGNDANNCTRAAPCRTLQRGIDATPAGTELQILDSGTYGSQAIISKSITISAVSVAATVDGIFVDAPGATVVLRGLVVRGSTVIASTGISVRSAAVVHIVGCEVEQAAAGGIKIEGDNIAALVADTVVRNSNFSGLLLDSDSENTRLTVMNSRFENNDQAGIGLFGQNSTATIEQTVTTGNGGAGVSVRNGTKAFVSNSVVTKNAVGLSQETGGELLSRINNTVISNGTNLSGTITPFDPT